MESTTSCDITACLLQCKALWFYFDVTGVEISLWHNRKTLMLAVIFANVCILSVGIVE